MNIKGFDHLMEGYEEVLCEIFKIEEELIEILATSRCKF